MIRTEEANNKITRKNVASMICDKNKEFKLFFLAHEYIMLCSSEHRDSGVKDGINKNKRQCIYKMTRKHYHLQ